MVFLHRQHETLAKNRVQGHAVRFEQNLAVSKRRVQDGNQRHVPDVLAGPGALCFQHDGLFLRERRREPQTPGLQWFDGPRQRQQGKRRGIAEAEQPGQLLLDWQPLQP